MKEMLSNHCVPGFPCNLRIPLPANRQMKLGMWKEKPGRRPGCFCKYLSELHSTGTDQKVGPGLAGMGRRVLKGNGHAVSEDHIRQVLQKGMGSRPGGLVKDAAAVSENSLAV